MPNTLIQRSRRVSPAEKAAFHQETGAGPRHVTREFLGLTDSDEEAIVTQIEKHLERIAQSPR